MFPGGCSISLAFTHESPSKTPAERDDDNVDDALHFPWLLFISISRSQTPTCTFNKWDFGLMWAMSRNVENGTCCCQKWNEPLHLNPLHHPRGLESLYLRTTTRKLHSTYWPSPSQKSILPRLFMNIKKRRILCKNRKPFKISNWSPLLCLAYFFRSVFFEIPSNLRKNGSKIWEAMKPCSKVPPLKAGE